MVRLYRRYKTGKKVKHKLKDIIVIVLFATLSDVDEQEAVNKDEGQALKKLICIYGKTMRSNKRKGSKPNHIVSAWSREDGFCLGQKAVDEKINEITAIPEVLDKIQIKGQVVTIDAMGTQTAIAEKIRAK